MCGARQQDAAEENLQFWWKKVKDLSDLGYL